MLAPVAGGLTVLDADLGGLLRQVGGHRVVPETRARLPVLANAKSF